MSETNDTPAKVCKQETSSQVFISINGNELCQVKPFKYIIVYLCVTISVYFLLRVHGSLYQW